MVENKKFSDMVLVYQPIVAEAPVKVAASSNAKVDSLEEGVSYFRTTLEAKFSDIDSKNSRSTEANACLSTS